MIANPGMITYAMFVKKRSHDNEQIPSLLVEFVTPPSLRWILLIPVNCWQSEPALKCRMNPKVKSPVSYKHVIILALRYHQGAPCSSHCSWHHFERMLKQWVFSTWKLPQKWETVHELFREAAVRLSKELHGNNALDLCEQTMESSKLKRRWLCCWWWVHKERWEISPKIFETNSKRMTGKSQKW